MPSTRVYGGATGDERWSERRAQLMSAGLDLMASSDGARAFTVRGVCRQARLASRYFYENFGDAGELATAIYDEEVLKLTTVTLAAMDGVPDDIPLVARAAIGAVIGQVADDPRRGRLLFSPALVAVPAIAERRHASTRLFVDLFQDEVRQRIPRMSASSSASGPAFEGRARRRDLRRGRLGGDVPTQLITVTAKSGPAGPPSVAM